MGLSSDIASAIATSVTGIIKTEFEKVRPQLQELSEEIIRQFSVLASKAIQVGWNQFVVDLKVFFEDPDFPLIG